MLISFCKSLITIILFYSIFSLLLHFLRSFVFNVLVGNIFHYKSQHKQKDFNIGDTVIICGNYSFGYYNRTAKVIKHIDNRKLLVKIYGQIFNNNLRIIILDNELRFPGFDIKADKKLFCKKLSK